MSAHTNRIANIVLAIAGAPKDEACWLRTTGTVGDLLGRDSNGKDSLRQLEPLRGLRRLSALSGLSYQQVHVKQAPRNSGPFSCMAAIEACNL